MSATANCVFDVALAKFGIKPLFRTRNIDICVLQLMKQQELFTSFNYETVFGGFLMLFLS